MSRKFVARAALFCLLVLSVARGADAQHVAMSFEQLAVLVNRGDTVTILDATGLQTHGTIADLSPQLLTVIADGTPRTLQHDEVSMIWERRHGSLETGAKWGLGFGVAVGALGAIGIAGGELGAGYAMTAAALWAAMGTGIGVGLSALCVHQDLIYAKPGTPSAVSFAPIVTRGRAALMMSLRF